MTRAHRSTLLTLLPLLALTSLAGCGGGEKAGQGNTAAAPAGSYHTFSGGPPGGIVVVLADREPDNLNPVTYNSLPAFWTVRLMFRALARRDSTLSHYAPDLAQSWELRPDSTLVLHLRHDVRWHDGVPVTSRDVVFTIDMQKNKLTASPRQADVAAVVKVSAPDSFTVEVKLNRTGIYTVNSLMEVVPIPEHLLKDVPPAQLASAPFNQKPVGNGFYRFGGWNRGQSLTLLADTAYPEGRAALDRVIMRFVPDMNSALTELLSGQGDLLPHLPPDQAERVKATQGVKLYQAPRVRPAWIAWNTRRPPFDDKRVRQALLMAIDRPAIARGLFGDVGEPALSPIPSAVSEHSKTVKPIPYNPQMAKQLLAQAGWRDTNGDGVVDKGGQPLKIEIDYISTDATRRDVLVAMQSMLKAVGVEMVPHPYESTAWVTRLRNRDFQGSFWGWGWGPGVMGPNAEMVFHSRSIPPAGANFASYSNPRVDALIDSTLALPAGPRLQSVWAALEQQLIDDAVYAPIYLDPEQYGVNARYANVKFRGIEWWEDVPYWYIPLDKRLPRDTR
jgi:peptide/nickel transport system substrate-binding protein